MDKVNDYVLELQEDQRQLHKNLDSWNPDWGNDKGTARWGYSGAVSYSPIYFLSAGEWRDYAIETSGSISQNPRSIKAVLGRIKQQLVRLKRQVSL